MTHILPPVSKTLSECQSQVPQVSQERREQLAALVNYVLQKKRAQAPVLLNFICTHNSRRSHLGQIWAKVAAEHAGVTEVTTFSGGTEATAFNPRAVAALVRAGFQIESTAGENPVYTVKYGSDAEPLACFSKIYDDPANPSADFAAVMTCTDADQNCPAILGATRISLPYRDPKEADDTPAEASRYDERSRQIATEMLFVFSEVKSQLER